MTWVDKDGVYHVEGSSPARAKRAPAPSSDKLPAWQRPNARPKKRAAAKSAAAGAAKAPKWWEKRTDAPPDEIDRAAERYKIPPELIRAVIAVESGGDAAAVSHKGALGLMQLMPQTAGEMYVQDPVDPAQNVQGGTRYLRYLANQFGGDMLLVLAAYNAGPEAVKKYGGVPPFAETREYVRKVTAKYFELKSSGKSAGKKVADSRSAR